MSGQISPGTERRNSNDVRSDALHGLPSPQSELFRRPEQALNRACESCRVSKVRCLANPDSSSAQCQRCAKANRACVFAPPAKRRQRKRTDVRVSELEREIKQMRDMLKPGHWESVEQSDQESAEEKSDENAQTTEKDPSPDRPVVHGKPENPGVSWTPSTSENIAAAPPPLPLSCGPSDPIGPVKDDILERGVITEAMAEELMNIWRKDLVGACPGITLPRHWTVQELRKNKPALFHAIMAAAAHSKGSAWSDRLHEEAVLLYARTTFIKGEKSVQAIQAFLVTVAYYSPPKTPGQLQIYQWVNMAASMALELGLASKPRTHEQLPKRAIRSLQRISSPEELLEHVRTVLILYVISAGFSMRLKRPNILLFNSWMEECVVLLERSKSLDDRRTIAWLRLQRIADEANTAFGFDDASTSFSLSELRMQMILRIFDRRMQDWKKSIPNEVMTLFLTIEYHQNILSMWEFGMDGGHYDVTEFRNRHLTLPALDSDSDEATDEPSTTGDPHSTRTKLTTGTSTSTTHPVQPESLLSRSALQINATIMCISAAHAILDTFLSISTPRLQKAPNVLYVRAVYALVALMKADYARGTDPEMRELLDEGSLRVEWYLDSVMRRTGEAVGEIKCRIPSHWMFVLRVKLRAWWDEYVAWRREGRGAKRRKKEREGAGDVGVSAGARQSQTGLGTRQIHSDAVIPPSNLPRPVPTIDTAPAPDIPFSLPTTFPTWSIQPEPSRQPPHQIPAQNTPTTTSFSPTLDLDTTLDLDFSAAFQNGDLYLWNELGADAFGGGWGGQGGGFGGWGGGGVGL